MSYVLGHCEWFPLEEVHSLHLFSVAGAFSVLAEEALPDPRSQFTPVFVLRVLIV